MSVVKAPNTMYFFIFAALLPVLPQLPKEKKKIKPHTTTTPKTTTKKPPYIPSCLWCNLPHEKILQVNLLQGICANESSGILRNAAKQISEKCKAKLIQGGKKMEISGSTYPTLLPNLGSFSQQRSCQLGRNLQDTSSLNSFSDNVNAYISQCSQWMHWVRLWITKIRTRNFTANHHQKTNPKLTVPNWKILNIVNMKTILTSLLNTQLFFLSTAAQIHYLQ